MIIEMAASTLISIGAISTRGSSAAARFVAAQTEQGRRRLQESYSLGLRGKGVFDDLCRNFEERRVANWDGYGAEPVSEEAYRIAYRFLEALPIGTPAPAIGAEPDGHVTLEWYRSPRRTLSVSVSPEGELHYAALLPGPKKEYGTVPFAGDVPSRVLEFIREVTGT